MLGGRCFTPPGLMPGDLGLSADRHAGVQVRASSLDRGYAEHRLRRAPAHAGVSRMLGPRERSGMSSAADGCAVILIPAVDETEFIASILAEIPRQLTSLARSDAIAIDGGSSDGTEGVAISAGADHVVRHQRRQDLARTSIIGMPAALPATPGASFRSTLTGSTWGLRDSEAPRAVPARQGRPHHRFASAPDDAAVLAHEADSRATR